MIFINRQEAGKQLAQKLKKYKGRDVAVYALPRGGVVLGYEVAKELKAPLDLIITRKIGHPFSKEYAVCAISEYGDFLCDEREKDNLDPIWLKVAIEKEKKEALRRRKLYLQNKIRIPAANKVAIVVDDGIATGLTMRAALMGLRGQKPKKLIVAVPVAPTDAIPDLIKEADEVVVLDDPKEYLGAVGAHYIDFPQVNDRDVIDLLKKSNI